MKLKNKYMLEKTVFNFRKIPHCIRNDCVLRKSCNFAIRNEKLHQL